MTRRLQNSTRIGARQEEAARCFALASRPLVPTLSNREGVNTMARKAVFYHAGCPVCADAERQFADKLNPGQYEVEIVHLGEVKSRIAEAEAAGVKSVPAFVIDGQPYHINFGASLSALK